MFTSIKKSDDSSLMRQVAVFLAVFASFVGSAAALAADCTGCRDTPFLPRYPNSQIVGFDDHAYEQGTFIAGPLPSEDNPGSVSDRMTVTGKRTQVFYFAPEGRSGLEVYENYLDAFRKSGLSTVYACSGTDECSAKLPAAIVSAMHLDLSNTAEARAGMPDAENPRYIFARQQRDDGNVYAAVLVADMPLHTPARAGAYLVTLQEKPMDRGMQTQDAATLDKSLSSNGKALIYGIHFDFDKSEIRSESKPQIEQIAQLMRRHDGWHLRITGFTDNIGSDAYNQALSERRAQAIVSALVQQQGIAADRLAAEGKGPSGPIASSDTEEGRAKNRRVELTRDDKN